MANKTIPELDEIEIDALDAEDLTILETAIRTYKLRMSTLIAFIRNQIRNVIELELEGTETGEYPIDLTEYEIDATVMIWMLRAPDGTQMPAAEIRATDADTLVIDFGEFSPEAGTYTLVGV